MIILSGVLVVLAIALLVTGIVTGNTGHEVLGLDGLKLIYVSIGVSIISALCLAIGVFLRRKELFGSAESQTSARRSAATRSAKAARTAKAKARVGAGDDAPVTAPSPTAAEVPAETSVYVVPGRKRYHLETCRQLAGREKEELTFVEAREEGFTACTACLPDTALAARAAHTGTTATTETLDPVPASNTAEPTTADAVSLADVDDDPAATRMDLPIARVDMDTTPDLTGVDFTDEHPAPIEVTDGAGYEDAGYEEPAASEVSPVSAEPTETGAPEETDEPPAAVTAQFDAISDAEPAPEQAAEERPLARSRSFFEPLDREETAADEEVEEEAVEDALAAQEPTAEDGAVEENLAEESPAEADAAEEDGGTAEESGTEEDTADAEAPADTDAADAVDADDAADADATEDDDASDDDASGADDEPDEPADAESGSAPADEAENEAEGDADEFTDEDDASPAEISEASEDGDTVDPDLPYVRILSGTKRYHRPDCALIEDIAEDADDLETVSPAEAKERGCTPCLVCQPDKSPSDRY